MIVKVGVVGFGMSATTFHLPFLNAENGFEVVAFMERSKTLSNAWFPDAKIYKTLDDLLEDSMIDLVVLTSPNQVHFEQAKQALRAGKHVLVEKPLCLTLEEAKELQNLSEQNNKVLSVFQNRRWDGDFMWLKSLVDSGLKIYEIDSRFDRFRDYLKGWKEYQEKGSGVLYDLGSHMIDQVYQLFGDNAELIFSDLQKQREVAENTDYFELQFKIKNGPKIILKAGMCCTKSYRFKVDTALGTYVVDEADQQESLLKKYGLKYSFELQERSVVKHFQPSGEFQELELPSGNYGAFYKELYQCISQKGVNPVSVSSILSTIKMIESLEG